MLFLMLPLAFALSAALSKIPDFSSLTERAVRRFLSGAKTLLCKTASADSERLAPGLSLLLLSAIVCLLSGLLEAVHPLLPALLIAPLVPLREFIRDALDVREALETGECTTDEERREYEQRIITAIGTLAQRCAPTLFMPLLAATLLLPLGLAPTAFWVLYVLRLHSGSCRWADSLCTVICRLSEVVMIACVIPTAALCGTEMGMAARARKLGVKNVLLNAVGIDPALKSGHRPVTGDISQSCLCVCIALALMYAVLSAVMFAVLAQAALI